MREKLRGGWQHNEFSNWWSEVNKSPSALDALVVSLQKQHQQHQHHQQQQGETSASEEDFRVSEVSVQEGAPG